MAIMTMRQRKQKLADAELDCELDRIRARRSTLKHRFKYNSAPRVRRRYSSAEVLRGHGGPELQTLVRDLLASGKIGCNYEAAREYRALTGKELPE